MRVTTRLVLVSVIAQDKNDAHVPDLRSEDFALLEDGKEQVISFFEKSSNRSPVAASASPATPIFTNRSVIRASTALNISVILFDALNTQIKDQAAARNQIVEFLRRLRPNDCVAIYVLGNGIKVLHDFSSDTVALLRTIEKFYGTPATRYDTTSAEIMQTGIPFFDLFAAESEKRAETQLIKNRVEATLQALEAIALHLAGIPGRKNLIWISAGFPLAIGMAAPELNYSRLDNLRGFNDGSRRAARAISQANIALYPIDSRGLFTQPLDSDRGKLVKPASDDLQSGSQSSSASSAGQAQSLNTPSSSAAIKRGGSSTVLRGTDVNSLVGPAEVDTTHDSMRLLAEMTGGRAFYNTNDLARSIREAMDDSADSYVLGNYPTHGKWDGRFREIGIRVKRPGTRVRHRPGYFAYENVPVTPESGRELLEDALGSPLQASALGLTATIEAAAGNEGPQQMRLQVDAWDVSLTPREEVVSGAIDLLLRMTDVQGATVWTDAKRITLNLKPATYHRALKEGFQIRAEVPRKADAVQLQVAVRDVNSGVIGTLQISMEELRRQGP